jgi:hypothetical protein
MRTKTTLKWEKQSSYETNLIEKKEKNGERGVENIVLFVLMIHGYNFMRLYKRTIHTNM